MGFSLHSIFYGYLLVGLNSTIEKNVSAE